MRRPALAIRAGVFALFCATPALAQAVWIVDAFNGAGADFTDMPAAVAAAGEGDLILLRDGIYTEFTITAKSLTIVADAGHHPLISERVLGSGSSQPVIRVFNLGASQEVALRGLELGGTYFQHFPGSPYILLQNNAGEVWIEDCALGVGATNFRAFTGIRAVNCAAVTASRCALTAINNRASHGVDATGSNVTLWDCEVLGGAGLQGTSLPPENGGHGIQIDGGTLFAAGCAITGGAGGWGANTFALGGAGGHGLTVNGNASVRLRDCVLAGGAGGEGTSGTGAAGQESVVGSGSLMPVNGSGRTLELSSPARAGVDPVSETYTGEPGDLVYLLWSYTGQMPPFFLGIGHGSFVIDITTLDGQAVGTVGAGGTLVVSVPPLTLIGPESLSFACQASFFQPGGGFFLSSPSLFTLLGPGI